MSIQELKDKLKRKNELINSQLEILDEYRNTIKFLETKVRRIEKEIKTYNEVCQHPYNYVTGKKVDMPKCQKCGKDLS